MKKVSIGERYNKLTVIGEQVGEKCLFQCDCGNIKSIRIYSVISGRVRSCGCLHIKDYTGVRFGRLVAVKYIDAGHWLCKCDCGNEKIISIQAMRKGYTKSCGCLKEEKKHFGNPTHKLSRTRIYKIWSSMKNRCYLKTHCAYARYGGRGIVVCDEWKDDFMAFYNWAIDNGYNDTLSIDRIDNNGNYEPSNCRWATAKQQQNNTIKNKKYTYNGETLTASQIAEKYNISYSTLKHRLNKGNDIKTAIETPIDLKKRRYPLKEQG